jgi:hypothetical protein
VCVLVVELVVVELLDVELGVELPPHAAITTVATSAAAGASTVVDSLRLLIG